MATSKTASFWLTEAVTMAPTEQIATGTLDLGAYVDVGDQQAIAVEQVDVIWQEYDGSTYNGMVANAVPSNAVFDVQLSDLNPGAVILRADDNTLVASASLSLDDTNNITSLGPDLFPDTYGKIDESRYVVNDQLYIVSSSTAAIAATRNLVATVRIKARIVKLSTKDWMAIAIQSTAADN